MNQSPLREAVSGNVIMEGDGSWRKNFTLIGPSLRTVRCLTSADGVKGDKHEMSHQPQFRSTPSTNGCINSTALAKSVAFCAAN